MTELLLGLTGLAGLAGAQAVRHDPPDLGLALLHQQLAVELSGLLLLLLLLLLQLAPLLLLAVPVGSLVLSVGLENILYFLLKIFSSHPSSRVRRIHQWRDFYFKIGLSSTLHSLEQNCVLFYILSQLVSTTGNIFVYFTAIVYLAGLSAVYFGSVVCKSPSWSPIFTFRYKHLTVRTTIK